MLLGRRVEIAIPRGGYTSDIGCVRRRKWPAFRSTVAFLCSPPRRWLTPHQAVTIRHPSWLIVGIGLCPFRGASNLSGNGSGGIRWVVMSQALLRSWCPYYFWPAVLHLLIDSRIRPELQPPPRWKSPTGSRTAATESPHVSWKRRTAAKPDAARLKYTPTVPAQRAFTSELTLWMNRVRWSDSVTALLAPSPRETRASQPCRSTKIPPLTWKSPRSLATSPARRPSIRGRMACDGQTQSRCGREVHPHGQWGWA